MSEIIKEVLEKLKQCDDFHNRCDFLMEHSEITYMLDYITNLQQENKKLKDNWNYIKKMLKEARQEKYISGYCGTCTDIDIDFLLDKMQELQGSDSND